MNMADESLLKDVYDFFLQLNKESFSLSPALNLTATQLKEKIHPKVQHLLTSEEEYVDPGSVSEGGRSDSSSSANSALKSETQKENNEIVQCAANSLTSATKSGWLDKKRPPEGVKNKFASVVNAYQKRYCIIQDSVFYYFINEQSSKQSGSFLLKEYEARPDPRQAKDVSKKDSTFSLVSLGNRSYSFMANDFNTMKSWIEAVAANSRVKHELDSITPPVEEQTKPSPVDDDADEYDAASTVPAPAPAPAPAPKIPNYKPPAPVPEIDEQAYDIATEGTPTNSIGRPLPERPAFKVPTPAQSNEEELENYDDASAALEEETYDSVGAEEKPSVKMLLPKRILPPRPDETPTPRVITVNENDYSNMFYGLWDCSTSQVHELPFNSGDIIQIIDREFSDKGWWTGYVDGKVGLVPKSYLMAAYAAA